MSPSYGRKKKKINLCFTLFEAVQDLLKVAVPFQEVDHLLHVLMLDSQMRHSLPRLWRLARRVAIVMSHNLLPILLFIFRTVTLD